MKKQRKLVVGFLLLLALVVSGFTYAYWAGTISVNNVENKQTITIGEANSVSTTLSVNDPSANKKLVPTGRVEQSVGGTEKNTDSVVFTFDNITWVQPAGNQLGTTTGTLTVSIADFQIGGVAEGNYERVNIVINTASQQIILGETIQTITVTVTMVDPKDKDAYEAIIDKAITFTVNFVVTNIASE